MCLSVWGPSPPRFMFGMLKQFCKFGIWSNPQCLNPVDALHTTWSNPPPPCYTLYKYIPLYFFTQGRGGGQPVTEKVRRALVYKRGRKYKYDWLYLQSINSNTCKDDIKVWCLYSCMMRHLQHSNENIQPFNYEIYSLRCWSWIEIRHTN